MRAPARRRRAIIRVRRRLGWDTGGHPGRCGCVDCNAQYGALHAPLCRCRECVDYGPYGNPAADSPFTMISNIEFTSAGDEEDEGLPLIAPITGFDLFLISKYANPQGS